MRTLKKTIALRQNELKEHPFFELIEAGQSVEELARMARAAVWWPMVFQDFLRLNVERIRGSGFERFAEYHRDEDSGHDQWFLGDLRTLGVEPPGLDDLFREEFQPIRDVCYSLIAEIHREQSGAQRVALLLALEPTGHVFFERIARAVERTCPDLPLRYFARSHLNVEKGHDLFSECTEADLDRIVLGDAERLQSEEAVARIYRAFTDYFAYLADRTRGNTRTVSHVSELRAPAAETRSVRDAAGS